MTSPLASAAMSGVPTSVSSATSVEALRSIAARDPKAAIRETAKQFEAIFMQQLMKSMREATLSSDMLENSGTKLGTEMLDSQYATKMTGLPGGLTDAIVRQLERQMGAAPTAAASAAAPAAAATGAAAASTTPLTQKQIDFVGKHQGEARAVESQSGIPAAFMLGQAAHESGWGQRAIKNADGSDSNNLFGIKAGAGWTGATTDITTTEYVDGQAQKVTAKFRSYASAEDAFRDYARLLKDNPRYAAVAAQASSTVASAASAQTFAQGLQKAGYATDPAYASKLSAVINTTLRMQRAVA